MAGAAACVARNTDFRSTSSTRSHSSSVVSSRSLPETRSPRCCGGRRGRPIGPPPPCPGAALLAPRDVRGEPRRLAPLGADQLDRLLGPRGGPGPRTGRARPPGRRGSPPPCRSRGPARASPRPSRSPPCPAAGRPCRGPPPSVRPRMTAVQPQGDPWARMPRPERGPTVMRITRGRRCGPWGGMTWAPTKRIAWPVFTTFTLTISTGLSVPLS